MKKHLIFTAIIFIICLMLVGCSAEKEVNNIIIAKDGVSEYTLLRPDYCHEKVTRAAGVINKKIGDICGADTVEYTTDWVGRNQAVPEGTKEILVGNTNRPESAEAYSLIPQRLNNKYDYAIIFKNDRIAIAGGSPEAIYNAAEYFCETYIQNGMIAVPENLTYVYKYPFPEISVGDNRLEDYTIVYQENQHYLYKQCAGKFNSFIEQTLGYTLPVDSDKNIDKYDKVIYFKYAPKYEYYVDVTDDSNIEIYGIPEMVEYAVSDYSAFFKVIMESAQLKKGTTIASESYLNILKGMSKPQTPLTPISSDYGRKAYAYHIIDDDNIRHWSGLMSSWDYDGRGVENITKNQYSTTVAIDASTTEPVYLTRQITPQDDGIITLEARYNCSGDGAVIELCNTKGEYALYLEYIDNKLCIKTSGELKELSNKSLGEQYLKVITNLYDGTNEVIYNNKNLGVYAFDGECSYFDMLRLGVTPEITGSMNPVAVKMYANYLVNERFIAPAETLDCDVDITYNGTGCAVKQNLGMNSGNQDSKSLEVNANTFKLEKSFEKTSGRIIFEGKFIAPKRVDGLTFALTMNGTPITSMKTENFGIFTGDGLLLRNYYSENVWHTMRIEADTATQKSIIKMNGKVLGTVYFEKSAEYLDGIEISYNSDKSAYFWLDEIQCYADPQFDDYVPEPVISDNKDYTVGINICSLWREGTHSGWDKISAYDEIKPYLGFYDEGIPEVQDWEIKWMTEHGIDFQLFCWYASSPDVPMMHTHLNDALMNGYMHAKYSDKMKFALLWECANAARPQNSDDFRGNFIPYFVEHYLSDSRYMTIDNKAVLAVFGADKLISDLGGTKKCKEELDYFRFICEKLDYDGAIIMACSSSGSQGSLESLKSAGFDAVYAYNWGKSGFDPIHTESSIRTQMSFNSIHVVPTLSTGFNNVGWAATRSPNMTVDNYNHMLSLFKNDLLKKYDNEKEDWKNSFIMLSTWNEYGEGTYIIPSGLNGFGYIDAVRDNYGDINAVHEDIVPTKEQLSRFTQMYSPERNILEPLYNIAPSMGDEVYYEYDFENNQQDCTKWVNSFGVSSLGYNSDVNGRSDVNDFAIKAIGIDKEYISLDELAGIKVVMKVDNDSNATFFFTTATDGSWNSKKGVSAAVQKSDDYVEYVFDARNVSTWTGTLKELRFDPLEKPGSFSIKSIKLIKKPKNKLSINQEPFENYHGFFMENDKIYVPVTPQSNLFYKLGIMHRWNKNDKTLTLYNSKAGVTFTIGSPTVITNVVDVYGFERPIDEHEVFNLAKPVEEYDGLPVICINELAELFDIEYELLEDNCINIIIK